MNMDDLEATFWRDNREQPVRVRLARVVRALRDEVDKIWTSEDMGCQSILDVFNEILDSDAGEKAAGRVGETKHPDVTSPATDPAPVNVAKMQRALLRKWRKAHSNPAPAVCVWVPDVQFRDAFSTECGYVAGKRPAGSPCICAKPIKFAEAQR